MLSDRRDSGQLEQVSDTVLMFSYPNAPDDDGDHIRECQIHVKKHRNGPTGVAHVQFNKQNTSFESLDAMAIEAQAQNRQGKNQPVPTDGKRKTWKLPAKQEEPS
jgi:hypothetical protein